VGFDLENESESVGLEKENGGFDLENVDVTFGSFVNDREIQLWCYLENLHDNEIQLVV